jgi:hypothetical protein
MHSIQKIIGLALVLVALGTATASASEFTSEAGEAEVTATQTESGKHVLAIEGSKMECGEATFQTEGEVADGESLQVHPVYGGCKSFGFIGATVTTTGCHYLFTAGSPTSSSTFNGSFHIICTGGAKIKIVAGTCEVQIGSQEALGSLMYTNLEGGELGFEFALEEIEAEKTKDGFLCPLSGTGATTASITGDSDASGTHEGSPTGIAVE